ncbi:MMPL family transporter [Streptomyces sp. NPDC058812]|uniref:MMPL family transporter n=1 Tax=Streptomyces sp. NPDC058812 TaxID=3346639 RepID=UPI0036B3CC07
MAGLLGLTPTGSIEPSSPVLMSCVAYGLSMDHEVFLPARVTEEHQRTGDTVRAVGEGIRRSAPLITAAAGILAPPSCRTPPAASCSWGNWGSAPR